MLSLRICLARTVVIYSLAAAPVDAVMMVASLVNGSVWVQVYAGKCRWRQYYIIDKILEMKDRIGNRQFLIKWAGYGQEHNTWEPRKNLTRELVNDFLLANDLYDHDWSGVRCPGCDQPCKSAFGLRMHSKYCIAKPETQQQFQGTCADRKVRHKKLEDAQATESRIKCEQFKLKNVFLFKYLGSVFAADGTHVHDVQHRINLAMARMGQLRHVFNSKIR